MIEEQVRIETEDGGMDAYTFRPDGEGAWPAVILYMDASGIREELCNMSRRIAGRLAQRRQLFLGGFRDHRP